MSKVKYRVREYNPTSAQQGSHSFFAEAFDMTVDLIDPRIANLAPLKVLS